MAEKVLQTRIRLRSGVTSALEASEEILLKGEIVIDTEANKMKCGDGLHTWSELPFMGADDAEIRALIAEQEDNCYLLVAEVADTDTNKLATIADPKKGDIAIVKRMIADTGKYTHTTYIYDTEWRAADGNYDASNVYFDNDLTYTAAIGVLAKPASSATLPAKGKTVKEVISSILAKEDPAAVATQPSAAITSSNIKSYEAGTKVKIQYSFSTNAGSYKYNPTATGCTFDNYSATFNGETLTTQNGTFAEMQVTDTTNLSISGSCHMNASTVVPKSNLGNEDPSKQIAAKDFTGLTKGTLRGYRNWFYGYKNGTNKINIASIDSAAIRGLSSGTSIPATLNTINMQQMFVCIPKGIKNKVTIANAVNGAPATVTKITDIAVEGANGYTATAYDVWYVDNAAADNGSNTYKITVS